MDVDLRLLRVFVAVAEELHFTRAAQRLHLAQPAVSKAVGQLEREVRAQLLRRTSRHVELTPAGRELLPGARRVLEGWEVALVGARRAAAEGARVVRVAYHSSVGRDLTAPVLARFRAAWPDWRVELRLSDWRDPSAGLLDGASDVALLRLPAPGQERLRAVVLRTEPRYLALPAGHRLARRRAVRLAEVGDEPFVAMPAETGASRDLWLAADERDAPPVVGAEASNPDDWLEAIANGQGLGVASAATREVYRRPGVVYRRLVDVSPTELAVATRLDERGRAVAAFVDACVAVAAERR